MSETVSTDAFARIIDHFAAPARATFTARLATLSTQLSPAETALIQAAADEALYNNTRLKLNRVLLLELHAARRAGELTAHDDAGQFAQFVEHCLLPAFTDHLDRRYPPLRARLQRALEQQRQAIERLVERFVADRDLLAPLLGGPAGELTGFSLGQGDLHDGGQTVAKLSVHGGAIMYKPRSLRVDAALEHFLAQVFGDEPHRVYVPAVLDRDRYGWAAFAKHRYCDNDEELRTFYRGLGHWLAVLRLLGGTDIHLENLIAVGPVPVVIDVESLFEIVPPAAPTPYGQAFDFAQSLIRNSVLRTGIVPFRTRALGFEGVDMSAAGALPDQQPKVRAPTIVDEGTTQARLKVVEIDVDVAQNHPSPRPDVSRYWDEISEGFLASTARLRRLDQAGELAPLLAGFEGCKVRDIRRTTRAYVEVGRMLWHPASLHKEAEAIERARDLFERNAIMAPNERSSQIDILAEIDALRYGDVPIFVEPLSADRIDGVLVDWRGMRSDLEELTIRSALVATDLNQRIRDREEERSGHRYVARHPHRDQLETRRRKVAAEAIARLLRLAVRGDDGSTTWITPEITQSGWLVQPVRADLYFGLGGVAVVLAGYQHEVEHGRADPVDGVEQALEGALQSQIAMEAIDVPDKVGGFTGYASQVWTWLTLHDLLRRPDIDGAAGTIVPLLGLAEATGDARWTALATRAAQRLEAGAIVDERGARWPTTGSPEPSNGFSHGATGIAWALARLVLAGAGDAQQRARWSALSDAGFAFQESCYDETLRNWFDSRELDGSVNFPTWCHGSVGIGLGACDLYARTRSPRHLLTMRRAVVAVRDQWGTSHTLCHGDMSLRELLVAAAALDPQQCATDPDEATAQIVSSIEEHRGMVGGLTRAAFTPGLMTGLSGAIHGLNRMHPQSGPRPGLCSLQRACAMLT
ncbi:MAG: type 2 lantipeptide synthetase LanM family protein [Lysobacter sp.]|nr:type 2 lantipeptide synthetase LanM family protein [Lysobacter sp.]